MTSPTPRSGRLSGDLLLYNSRASGKTFIQDVASGTVRELPLAWPAAFDASGTLVYSPASGDPKAQGLQTTVIDASTGAVVETLDGAPTSASAYLLLDGVRALARTNDGIVAALQGAPGCAGTAIYVDATVSQCVAGGVHGEVSPEGVVAVARSTGSTGPVYGPGFSMLSMDRFDIDVVSPHGQPRTVIHDALSPIDLTLTWSADGSHLLVLWPSGGGFK